MRFKIIHVECNEELKDISFNSIDELVLECPKCHIKIVVILESEMI